MVRSKNFAIKLGWTLLLVVCGISAVAIINILHDKPAHRKSLASIPNAACPGSAFRVGLSTLNETVSKVPIIVIASLEERTKTGATFKIQKILKGDQLSKGDLISVCPGFSSAVKGESFSSTLLLLNGMEKESHRWVPEELEFGVIPIHKDRFLIRSIHEDGTYYSTEEIERAINRSTK
jgi:hypothetical protein